MERGPQVRRTYLARWARAVVLDVDHVAVDLRIDVPTQVATPACSPGAPVTVSLPRLRVAVPGGRAA